MCLSFFFFLLINYNLFDVIKINFSNDHFNPASSVTEAEKGFVDYNNF